MEPAFQVRDVRVAFMGALGEFKSVRGFVFGFDPYWGGTYIYVDPKQVKLTPLPLGDSETIRTGAPLVALSRQSTILVSQATGKVTQVWRVDDIASGMKVVRTLRVDAVFPQGNDNRTEALPYIGSPLLDAKGRVVAVVGPDLQPQTGGQQGVGCAQAIRGLLANLSLYNQRYQGTHTRLLSLGATCYPAEQAKRLGVPVAHGILVEYVFPGEAAARAGIRGGNRAGTYTYDNDGELITDQCVVGGDVIVAVDGKPITGSNWEAWGQYTQACDKKPGDSVRLTLLRGNRRFTVTLPLDVIPYSSPSV